MTRYISEVEALRNAWLHAGSPRDPAIIEAVLAGVRADRAALTPDEVATALPPRPDTPATVHCIGRGHHARAERRALAVEAALWIAALLAAVGAVTLMLGWWPR